MASTDEYYHIINYSAEYVPPNCSEQLKSMRRHMKELCTTWYQRNKTNSDLINRPLHEAVRCGYTYLLSQLLKIGEDVNLKNSEGFTPLHLAAYRGDVTIVEALISCGAHLNILDDDGHTPLHLAVSREDELTVECLLKSGADVNMVDKSGWSPLHWAVNFEKLHFVDQLLRHGANVNIKDTKGTTPLYLAVCSQKVSIIELLLKFGADVNAADNNNISLLHLAVCADDEIILNVLLKFGSNINLKDNSGFTPLHWAVYRKSLYNVERLLNCGFDVNSKDNNGYPLLHWAVRYKEAPIVQLLMKFGANLNATDYEGVSALHLAIFCKETTILKLLLELNADAKIKDSKGFTALHWAIYREEVSAIDLLLNHDVDVNITDIYGYTPLHFAVLNENVSIVRMLLMSRANVNATSEDRVTPLYLAVETKNRQCVDELLRHGADVTATDNNGVSAVHLAAYSKCTAVRDDCTKSPVLDLLLKFGANVDTIDRNGYTPLHWAAQYSKKSVVKELLEHDASVHIMDTNDGRTALHLAVCHEDTVITEELLKCGANINKKDNYGMTPLHLAIHHGNMSIMEKLLKFGAMVNAIDNEGNTPLHLAAQQGKPMLMNMLLDFGGDIYMANNIGITPLYLATLAEKTEDITKSCYDKEIVGIESDDIYVSLDINGDVYIACNCFMPLLWAAFRGEEHLLIGMLNYGADVNMKDCNGYTLLHWAVQYGKESIVNLLLKFGANVNTADKFKSTPLHRALELNAHSLIEPLLNHGADTNAMDSKGNTPLHLLVERQYFLSTLNLLLKFGVNLNSSDKNGYTPLHWVAHTGKLATLNWLLSNGANVDATAKNDYTPLHWAVKRGRASIVCSLIKYGADVNKICDFGETPLHWAVARGKVSIVNLLLKFGADVNKPDINSDTPLHWAVPRGKTTIIDLLLKSGADVNISNKNCTPLYWAVRRGKASIVSLLLKHGAEVNSVCYDAETPLLCAVRFRQVSVVNLLLESGASINKTHNNGITPLHYAVHYKSAAIVNIFLNFSADISIVDGYDKPYLDQTLKKGETSVGMNQYFLFNMVNAKDDNGNTPLHWAAYNDKTAIAAQLLDKGADVNAVTTNDIRTPLHVAAETGKSNMMNWLINHGANVNATTSDGITPLQFAVLTAKSVNLQQLIKFCTDINVKDDLGKTPLHTAVYENKTVIMNQLLEYGADVNTTDDNGNTVLHLAVLKGNIGVVEVLLRCNADITKTNSDGNTPLHLAANYGWDKILKILLSVSDDTLNLTNSTGNTPLHLAVSRGHTVIVKAMLKYPVDVNILNKNSDSPLHLAVKLENANIVSLLLAFGVDINVTNSHGDAALHISAQQGEINLVGLLLKFNTRVNVSNNSGNTPLHLVAHNQNKGIINLLLDNGADVNIANDIGSTPLHVAVLRGHGHVIDIMLNCGADVQSKNINGNIPLHLAARRGDASILYHLLNYETDINTKDGFNNTLLHLAVSFWNINLIRYLLMLGADVNTANRIGITPLHLAVLYGDITKVQLLLKFEANVNCNSMTINPPLHLAIIYGKTPIVKELLKFGADVNSTSTISNKSLSLAMLLGDLACDGPEMYTMEKKVSNKPLHLAVFHRNTDMVDLLLKHGATINVINGTGNTPLHLAARRGDTGIVNLLLDRGANVTIRNLDWDTPLTVARVYHFQGNNDVVKLLETVEKSLTNSNISNKQTAHTQTSDSNFQNKSQRSNLSNVMQSQFKYLKRVGTSGISGQLYVTKLLSLVLIRALNDEEIEYFLLGANLSGIDTMTDICLRYRLKSQKKPFLLFVEAKHIEDCEKRKLTAEDLLSSNSEFSLRKYFESYLAIKSRFHSDNEDPMFEGNFQDVECNMIIYTPAKNLFSTKKKEAKLKEKVNNLIITGENKALQYEYDETNVDYLTEIKIMKKLEKLSIVFLKLFFTKEDNIDTILLDTLIGRYHMVIGYSILQLCTEQDSNKKYCVWEFRPDFFNSDCKYLKTLKNSIVKEISTKCYDYPKCNQEDRENLALVIQTPSPKTISKVIGKLVTYNYKSKKLQILKMTKEKHDLEFEMLVRRIKMITIDENTISEAVRIKLTALTLKLPRCFGSLEMTTIHGNEVDIKNATGAKNGVNQTNINNKKNIYLSFEGKDEDRDDARNFLDNLWFYTNQAKENEVELILKDLINKHYNIDKKSNHFIFQLHSNAIYLRSHDEIQKWWMKRGKISYLSNKSNIFKRAKLACFRNLLLTVINFMYSSKYCSINFNLNQRIHECGSVPKPFTIILDKLFNKLDTQSNTINFNINDKKEIVNLLQHFEESTAKNISLHSIINQIETPDNILQSSSSKIRSNQLQNNPQLQYRYLKKHDTCGIFGQLYETKLLCLVFIRALNDEQIEHFLLGTNIRGIGDMDDICLRYRVEKQQKAVVLFVQAKHRENCKKRILTVQDIQSPTGDFSLRRYFESYLAVKERFQSDNKDPMFEGLFTDVECNFVIYTPAKESIAKKTLKHTINEKIDRLLNTGQNAVFQFDYNENDIEYLTDIIVINRIETFARVFLEAILPEKYKSDVILLDKFIASYHVVIGREVLHHCNNQPLNEEFRLWKFRSEFFNSNCKYLIAMKNIIIRHLSTLRCDKTQITYDDQEHFINILANPCACTISKVIGKLVIYNYKTKKLQLIDVSEFKKKFANEEYTTLREKLNNVIVDDNIIADAVRIKLTTLTIKLPRSFGNLDMTFRGSENKIERRIKALAQKLINLFEINQKTKVLNINDQVVGPGNRIEQGIIDINGGIGSAVGNLLILEQKTKMLKLDLGNKSLPKYASLFLNELQSDRYYPVNNELHLYRIKINIDGFPKESFNADEHDKTQAKGFLNKLWFYTDQAKEDEVEEILKMDINNFYTNKVSQKNNINKNNLDPSHSIFLTSHEEIQKWWMQTNESPYLSRASKLFEQAKLADIDNLLLTVINYMYTSKIYNIDIHVRQSYTDYDKLVEMHQTFNKISERLFKIFDSEFNEVIDINLPDMFQENHSDIDVVDLIFILEIHPEMEWVALKISAETDYTNYFLIAKAGPGSGSRRAKDGFLLQQLYSGDQGYFFEGGKDPDDIYGHFRQKIKI